MNLDKLRAVDCEVYPNYFLVSFKSLWNNKVKSFELRGDAQFTPEQADKLDRYLKKIPTFGFNSRKYDLTILTAAVKINPTSFIHKVSDQLILGDDPHWVVERAHHLSRPNWPHFDLQEPAPGVMVSLKLYGGRMHSKRLQDLPIAPGTHLTEQQMDEIKAYCENDLDTTIDLFNAIKPQLQLRSDMSEQYDLDLMSKSDAQIAEAVLKHGERIDKPNTDLENTFTYDVPEYIEFETEQLNTVLDIIRQHEFSLDKRGSVKLPEELHKMSIKIGGSEYQIGIGGLHSKEKCQTVVPTKYEVLADRDVTSYYPNIILSRGLFPEQFGEKFLDKYRGIVERRIEAKRTRDKVTDQSLKITINGSFGKLGSRYSALYSPNLMLAVTLTGQLSLLMLIEQLELEGISVVSANTDGFVSLIPNDLYDFYNSICFAWELDTSFNLEETRYKALYSRDVNNYLAVTEYGAKGKGVFAEPGLMKNPQAYICVEAAIAYLTDGVDILDTLRACRDITQFLTVRRVNGGAVWRDEYLGKVVRFIWSTDGDKITYQANGNKVSTSDGARPIMEIGEFPNDIDYEKYVDVTEEIIKSVGVA